MTRWAAICVLAAGIGLRVQQFLSGRSLWIDEATLALNIASRSFAQLLAPLDYHQAAPLGYLLAVRSVTAVLGVGERSLRLVSLLAGCVLLVVLWRLATRLIGEPGGVVATAVAAFAPVLVYYSNEVKPYASDALIATVLLAMAAKSIATEPSRHGWTLLALAGAIAVWLSAPAVFVVAGIGTVMLVAALRAADRARVAGVVAAGTIWAASFLGAYLMVYRNAGRSGYMREFWEGGHLAAGSLRDIAESLRMVSEMLWEIFIGSPPGSGPLRLDLVVLGGVALALGVLMRLGFAHIRGRRGAATAWLPAAPALVVAAASFAHLYPVSARLLVFLVPGAVLLIAAGIVRVARAFTPGARGPLTVALAAALPLAGIDPEGHWAMAPMQWSDTREVIGILEADRGDAPVYVSARAIPAYTFYTTDWARPDLPRLRRIHSFAVPGGPAFENASRGDAAVGHEGDDLVVESRRRELLGLASGMQWRARVGLSRLEPSEGWARNEARRIRDAADPGVWLLFTHLIDGAEVSLLRDLERTGGVRRTTVARRGALLFRYDFPRVR